MSDIASTETAACLHAAHYRQEAARFRTMAQAETLVALRQRLNVIAAEYEPLAEDAERNPEP